MNNHPLRPSWTGRVLGCFGVAALGLGAVCALAADPPSAAPQQAGGVRDQKAGTPAGHDNPEMRGRRHEMGLQLESRNNQLVVSRVDQGSPAAQAGLRQNDRIVSVDGRPFTRLDSFHAYIAGQAARLIPIVFERDGQQYTAYVNNVPFAGGAWLGVYLEEDDKDSHGARISRVYPASPAARAGLSPEDMITEVGGQNIAGSAELIAMLRQMQPHARIELTVARNGRELTVPVVLASRVSYVFQDFPFRDDLDDDRQTYHSQSYGMPSDDSYDDIHPEAMRLEHDRRIAEQHQRIEEELRRLREEIAKLRQDLQSRK